MTSDLQKLEQLVATAAMETGQAASVTQVAPDQYAVVVGTESMTGSYADVHAYLTGVVSPEPSGEGS